MQHETTSIDTGQTFLFLVPKLYRFDATSVDLFHQAKGIKSQGFRVSIYSESTEGFQWDEGLLTRKEAIELMSLKTTTVICHFCGFDRNLFLFGRRTKGQFFLRYHNVTPPRWSLPYSPRGFLYSLLGRFQAWAFVMLGRADLLLPASRFNATELLKYIPKTLRPKVVVIPVLGEYDRFRSIKRASKDTGTDIHALFVGRIVPTKGLGHLIEVLKEWNAHYQSGTHLQLKITVAGKVASNFRPYQLRLVQLAAEEGFQNNICFVEEPSMTELIDLYTNADVFICPSEHEGFGVPLVEAQCARLPIVALDRGAVSETMGEGGLLVQNSTSPGAGLSQCIFQLMSDQKLRETIVEKGLRNLDRFDLVKVIKSLLTAVL